MSNGIGGSVSLSSSGTSVPTSTSTSSTAAGSGFGITGSTILSGASQLATQASATLGLVTQVRQPNVGPAIGSPAASAAWMVLETILQTKITQLGTGLAGTATAMNAMVANYGNAEAGATSMLGTTAAKLGTGSVR
jgi:hypothetical protein